MKTVEIKPQIKKKQMRTIDDGTFYKFENVGDTISGTLKEKGLSEKWNVGLYEIETEPDKRVRFLGKTQLDRLMKQVDIDTFVEIELIDTQKTPNGNMLIFEVRVEE